MGLFLKEHDIYIGTFLEMLNLRFAPTQIPADGPGGVEEMVELQKEFQVFAKGHTFRQCASVLGLGGFWNWKAKNRWFELLGWLEKCPSETKQNGSERIVAVIKENLESKSPQPMQFVSHDKAKDPRVLVQFGNKPQFYFVEQFITISLPMAPRKR